MSVSGKTKVCGIIGDPVEHSMSPAMHNAAFKKLGLDYAYVPFWVKPEALTEAVAGLRALNIVGFNVTIPHKVSILPLLDSVDPLAERIGAVNTVVNVDGELRGCNTDAEGFFFFFLEYGVNVSGKKVVVLGAGGASRAISYTLAKMGARLVILNREAGLSRAEAIASIIQTDLDTAVQVLPVDLIEECLTGAELLVNATSAGMYPYAKESPLPVILSLKVPVVFDIVYNPVETRLLREAKKAGSKIITGIDMLAWQGAQAFEKWTALKAPVEVMRREVVKMLEKHEN